MFEIRWLKVMKDTQGVLKDAKEIWQHRQDEKDFFHSESMKSLHNSLTTYF